MRRILLFSLLSLCVGTSLGQVDIIRRISAPAGGGGGGVTKVAGGTDYSGWTDVLTTSVSIPSGTDLILIHSAMSSANTISSVTVGGEACTEKKTSANGSTGAGLWYRVSPTSGTKDIVVTWSGAGALTMIYKCYSGVNTGTPLGTAVEDNSGWTDAPSNNVSSATGELVVDFATEAWSAVTGTAGAGQTEEEQDESNLPYCWSSSEAGASSVTMSWSLSGAGSCTHISVPIKPE